VIVGDVSWRLLWSYSGRGRKSKGFLKGTKRGHTCNEMEREIG
jgi:hypothetical protein